MHPILRVGVKAARRAGNIILRHMGNLEQITVEKKGRNDFVSQIDRLAEEDIIDTIRYGYPDHAIVAEESGTQKGKDAITDKHDSYKWIIDPLDGTTNYLHGHPQFAVSIGVTRNDILEHAIIFDPLRDELYTATRGSGAHLNDRRIRVSKAHKLEGALLATGFPFKKLEYIDAWKRVFTALLPKVSDIRRAGAASLDLAYLACGRVDGFWEAGLKPWDIAAGCLLIREAGGLIADFQGNQEYMQSGHLVAANALIFNELLKIVNSRAGEIR